MCRSKSEGGQRCYGHASEKLLLARSALDRASTPQEQDRVLQKVLQAQIELASTPRGAAEFQEAIAASADGSFERRMLERIVERGAELRERNQAVFDAVRSRSASLPTEARNAESERLAQVIPIGSAPSLRTTPGIDAATGVERDTDRAVEVASTGSSGEAAGRTSATVTNDGQYTTVRGSRYTGWRDVSAIAKDVRADIKNAIRAGSLPSAMGGHALTYSVTTKKYADGQSLKVQVQGLPDSAIYDSRDDSGYRQESEQVRTLRRRVQAVATAYDRSTTDPDTDYYHSTYHCDVSIEDDRAALWRRDSKHMAGIKTALGKARRAGDQAAVTVLNEQLQGAQREHRQRLAALNDRDEFERDAWRAAVAHR